MISVICFCHSATNEDGFHEYSDAIVDDRRNNPEGQQGATLQENEQERTLVIDNTYYGVDDTEMAAIGQPTTVKTVENEYYGVYDDLQIDGQNTAVKLVENQYYE